MVLTVGISIWLVSRVNALSAASSDRPEDRRPQWPLPRLLAVIGAGLLSLSRVSLVLTHDVLRSQIPEDTRKVLFRVDQGLAFFGAAALLGAVVLLMRGDHPVGSENTAEADEKEPLVKSSA